MKIRECMTGQPITIQANESIVNAAKIMRECDVGAVPVLLEDKLVGVLTDRDVVIRGIATGLDLNTHQAQEIMTPNPKTITPEAGFEEAARIMGDAKIRRLPVVEDGKLVGLVSLGDLAVAHKGHEDVCGLVLENVSEPIGPKCAM